MMVGYDAVLFALAIIWVLIFYPYGVRGLTQLEVLLQAFAAMAFVFAARLLGKVYQQIWRYASTQAYIRLILCDAAAGGAFYTIQYLLGMPRLGFMEAVSVVCLDLLLAIVMRLGYRYMHEYTAGKSRLRSFLRKLASKLFGIEVNPDISEQEHSEAAHSRRIDIAIVGAGRVGVMLAEELLGNPHASYMPRCFVDIDREKIGRYICGIPVYSESEMTAERLNQYHIQEIVFALP